MNLGWKDFQFWVEGWRVGGLGGWSGASPDAANKSTRAQSGFCLVSSSLNRPMTSKAFAPLPLQQWAAPTTDHSFTYHTPTTTPILQRQRQRQRAMPMPISSFPLDPKSKTKHRNPSPYLPTYLPTLRSQLHLLLLLHLTSTFPPPSLLPPVPQMLFPPVTPTPEKLEG
jgi:hypothetical protein